MNCLFSPFDALSLRELNDRAPLMIRRDSKYLVNTEQLQAFLTQIQPEFDVLEIDNYRQFQYHTLYLDTANQQCYQDHNKGRRRRMKLRFRHYIESSLFFLELKLKGQRNLTKKYRQAVCEHTFRQGLLTPELKAFVNDKLQQHYQRQLEQSYHPSLLVKYLRTTLVSKFGAERITIDNLLHFNDLDAAIDADPNLWIIEVKSKTGASPVDKILYKFKARPIPSCSKYCVGLTLTQPKTNRFTPVVKKFTQQQS